MKPSQIIDLIIRIIGFVALFLSAAMLMNMILTGINMGFRQFLWIAANGALGVAVMKAAPLITEFTYGSEK